MALWPAAPGKAAVTGRTHDRTNQRCVETSENPCQRGSRPHTTHRYRSGIDTLLDLHFVRENRRLRPYPEVFSMNDLVRFRSVSVPNALIEAHGMVCYR